MKKLISMLVVLNLMILVSNLHAYLDPGTGSYVLQVLIAAIAGSAFAIKMSWHKIKAFFKGGKGDAGRQQQQ